MRIPQQIRSDAPYKGAQVKNISKHARPSFPWAKEQCARMGLDFAGVCRRALDRGPLAVFLSEAEAIKKTYGRPYTLKGLSGRMLARPSDETAAFEAMQTIDAFRLEDPKKAARYARQALECAAGPVACGYILGALASTHLQMFRLDWAMVELGEAIAHADIAERRDVVAELMRRATCALRDRVKLGEAEAMIREALSLCETQGNEAGAAYCLVELAITLRNRSQPEAAIRRLGAAAALEMKRERYRYAVPHNLALCLIDLGDLEGAEKAASKAAALLPRGRIAGGYLAWLRARIAWQCERFTQAARFCAQAYEATDEPTDRLLIGAEWVRATLAMGRPAEAARNAEALLVLHRPLERDSLDEKRVLSTAVLELALAGRRTAVTTELVAKTLVKIRKGRKDRYTRLRERMRPPKKSR
ncbi:MAG: hypothetical protein K0U93_03230 [Gammaproteobacteria bacterium]|nr:hypothetical protein [Gammaproteobacteria bacterium]